MNRDGAIARAAAYFDSGAFSRDLARRVACPTESQNADRAAELRAYLDEQIAPALAALGLATRVVANPISGAPPLLIGERIESPALATVLMYGHGDVVRGQDDRWSEGLSPWTVTQRGDKLYGRGSADNKGQHSINLGALAAVLAERGGRLGFNLKWLFEMGEETGSPGLAELAAAERDALGADVLIASDGPRLRADRPTLFLGSRGVANFDLVCRLREGAHHSGNWGGLLRNPATVIAAAIASLVDGRGRILVAGLRPPPIPDAVRAALAEIEVGGGAGDPSIDADWGEPGLTPAERVFGWNTLEVLALAAGNAAQPVNAIPPEARAHCQLRFVVGTDWQHLREHVQAHLVAHGLSTVEVGEPVTMAATRLDPESPWVRWALASIERTSGRRPALLPNLGGSLPNDVFADTLGLPTLWVPHSYPACAQHAPDEHLLAPVACEALQIMAGLFWDLGDGAPAARRLA
ncbi:MAG: M20 family metallopeptidase [Piscinibacter sp.]|nr:M20 family metallopeptidase [Piscinibacter sp.]